MLFLFSFISTMTCGTRIFLDKLKPQKGGVEKHLLHRMPWGLKISAKARLLFLSYTFLSRLLDSYSFDWLWIFSSDSQKFYLKRNLLVFQSAVLSEGSKSIVYGRGLSG